MCGISCVVALKGQTRSTHSRQTKCPQESSKHERAHLSKTLDESLEIIKYRGPDARGQWISGNCRVALGHNRLSIVDLSPEAEQPFHDSANEIHAVITGEFYDYQSIRESLVQKGYGFQSMCDSEIVIALYKEYGMSFLTHLRGEFALCLYDEKAQFFVAARDRYGIKPLHYTIHDGKLLIASEAKAFLPFGWRPEWDVQSLGENGWMCDQRTLFQGVQKIRGGHYLVCTSFGAIEERKYWDMNYKDKHEVETRTEEEMILEVRERLLDAVRVRLRADVPVGVFLSGGIDSSAIAGMVKHLMETEDVSLGTRATDRLNCFSIKFMDEDFDEEPIAQRTAEWLGVKENLHVVKMTEEALASAFDDTAWHNELPMGDLGTIGKFALSQLPQAHGCKVILTGEGSDEHFAGYSGLLTDFLREQDYSWLANNLPEEDRLKSFNALEYRTDYTAAKIGDFRLKNDPPTADFAKRQINNVSFIGFTDFVQYMKYFASWTEREFGTIDKRTVAVHNTLDGITRDLVANKWHPLHSALYLWSKCALANILLVALGDRTEMAHSIEGRQPFLDHHLTEYVMSLPPSMKFRYDPETKTFCEKWILKEAMKPFITEEMYKRRKHPYSAPIKYKVGGPVHQTLSRLVTKENIDALGFLNWSLCEHLVEDAIVKGDVLKMREVAVIAQFVAIGKRFGVETARPEFPQPEVMQAKRANGHRL